MAAALLFNSVWGLLGLTLGWVLFVFSGAVCLETVPRREEETFTCDPLTVRLLGSKPFKPPRLLLASAAVFVRTFRPLSGCLGPFAGEDREGEDTRWWRWRWPGEEVAVVAVSLTGRKVLPK